MGEIDLEHPEDIGHVGFVVVGEMPEERLHCAYGPYEHRALAHDAIPRLKSQFEGKHVHWSVMHLHTEGD